MCECCCKGKQTGRIWSMTPEEVLLKGNSARRANLNIYLTMYDDKTPFTSDNMYNYVNYFPTRDVLYPQDNPPMPPQWVDKVTMTNISSSNVPLSTYGSMKASELQTCESLPHTGRVLTSDNELLCESCRKLQMSELLYSNDNILCDSCALELSSTCASKMQVNPSQPPSNELLCESCAKIVNERKCDCCDCMP